MIVLQGGSDTRGSEKGGEDMGRRNRAGLGRNEVRIQGGQIANRVEALNGNRIAYIVGLTAAERAEVAVLVRRVLRGQQGQALNGLVIQMTRNWGGHAYRGQNRITVGTGRYVSYVNGVRQRVLGDDWMGTLLHEMAHIIVGARCLRGCARGGACGCVHNLEFHQVAFGLYARYLNAEDAADKRRAEYGYHTRIAGEAARGIRKGAEFRAWQRERRAAATGEAA